MRLLLLGMKYNDIGSALNISLGTVRTQVASIYKKLDVTNRQEMVLAGIGNGLISIELVFNIAHSFVQEDDKRTVYLRFCNDKAHDENGRSGCTNHSDEDKSEICRDEHATTRRVLRSPSRYYTPPTETHGANRRTVENL